MSKKLSNNGLWESNRMMLPQHREAIKYRQSVGTSKKRPELDSQEMELIAAAIRESYVQQTEVKLQLFDEYTDKIVTGIVLSINQHGRRKLKLKCNDDIEDVRLETVIGIR